jgi:hypothetical protein
MVDEKFSHGCKLLATASLVEFLCYGRVLLVRLGTDLLAFLHLLRAFGNDALTRFKAFIDYPPRADLLTHFDRADAGLVVMIDYGYEVSTLQLTHGTLRHE